MESGVMSGYIQVHCRVTRQHVHTRGVLKTAGLGENRAFSRTKLPRSLHQQQILCLLLFIVLVISTDSVLSVQYRRELSYYYLMDPQSVH